MIILHRLVKLFFLFSLLLIGTAFIFQDFITLKIQSKWKHFNSIKHEKEYLLYLKSLHLHHLKSLLEKHSIVEKEIVNPSRLEHLHYLIINYRPIPQTYLSAHKQLFLFIEQLKALALEESRQKRRSFMTKKQKQSIRDKMKNLLNHYSTLEQIYLETSKGDKNQINPFIE